MRRRWGPGGSPGGLGGDGQPQQQLGEDVELSVEELRAAATSKAAGVAARPCLVEAGPETMSGGAGAPLPTGGPESGGGSGGSGGGTRSSATAAAGGGVVNGDTSSPLIGWEEPAACLPAPGGSRRRFKSGGETAGTSVPAGGMTAGRTGAETPPVRPPAALPLRGRRAMVGARHARRRDPWNRREGKAALLLSRVHEGKELMGSGWQGDVAAAATPASFPTMSQQR